MCELQVQTTRRENLIPIVTRCEGRGVKTLRAQGGEGMRAGKQLWGCQGQVKWEAARNEMGQGGGRDQILMAELSGRLRRI